MGDADVGDADVGDADVGVTLNVGVTGHRAMRLPQGCMAALPPLLGTTFAALRDAVADVLPDRPGVSSARVALHTPLATGADQIATIAAAALGYRIEALLPFAANDYATDFAPGAERAELARLLAQADTVTALPGERSRGSEAYVALGEALVARSDIIIAVWDGSAAVAPGGTAHVVALAQTAGVPVLHVGVGASCADVPVLLAAHSGDRHGGGVPMVSAADYRKLVGSVLVPRIAGRL